MSEMHSKLEQMRRGLDSGLSREDIAWLLETAGRLEAENDRLRGALKAGLQPLEELLKSTGAPTVAAPPAQGEPRREYRPTASAPAGTAAGKSPAAGAGVKSPAADATRWAEMFKEPAKARTIPHAAPGHEIGFPELSPKPARKHSIFSVLLWGILFILIVILGTFTGLKLYFTLFPA